ncbi:MAG: aminoacyl-tRNA hydrolase [Stagnimonas sp.]|nr:aminoacyl-tRNA hydrolase [Stagnimonas sp.]
MPTPTQILIAGLGNPGPDYAQTRHNAGFWFADAVADRFKGTWKVDSKFFGETARVKIEGVDVLLLKPSTFMNRSGQSVQEMMNFYKLAPDALLAAHDELDMPAGQMRLKFGGGHGGHNGLRDIHKPLGDGYRRLRVGIGHPGDKNLVLNYVLARPSKADEQLIRTGIDNAVNALPIWLSQTWEKALNQLHTA